MQLSQPRIILISFMIFFGIITLLDNSSAVKLSSLIHSWNSFIHPTRIFLLKHLAKLYEYLFVNLFLKFSFIEFEII